MGNAQQNRKSDGLEDELKSNSEKLPTLSNTVKEKGEEAKKSPDVVVGDGLGAGAGTAENGSLNLAEVPPFPDFLLVDSVRMTKTRETQYENGGWFNPWVMGWSQDGWSCPGLFQPGPTMNGMCYSCRNYGHTRRFCPGIKAIEDNCLIWWQDSNKKNIWYYQEFEDVSKGTWRVTEYTLPQLYVPRWWRGS